MFNQWSSTTEKTFYNDLDTEDFILRPVNLDDDDDDLVYRLCDMSDHHSIWSILLQLYSLLYCVFVSFFVKL